MLELELAALATQTIDFDNDALELEFENSLTSFGKLAKTTVELDQLTDESVLPVAQSVLNLAKQFGVAFKGLTEAQSLAVKEAVKGIVTGENETLIERFFDESLDFIIAGQKLNVAANTPTV